MSEEEEAGKLLEERGFLEYKIVHNPRAKMDALKWSCKIKAWAPVPGGARGFGATPAEAVRKALACGPVLPLPGSKEDEEE